MPSYKPEQHSEWYLLRSGAPANDEDTQSDSERATPPRTSSASPSNTSVRNLNNGFSMNPDGQVFWGKTMSVGEPQLANVLAERGVDLTKKYRLTQTSQGAVYRTSSPDKLFYSCGQGHPVKKGRRLSQTSGPPSRRVSTGSVSSHSTVDDQDFGMGIIRKDSRDSETQFMGNVKHKYRIKRDSTELYKETIITPNFSQKRGDVLPADELLLKKRSPSKTALRGEKKTNKNPQAAVTGKPALKKRTSSTASSIASSTASSVSSHESFGSEHSVSGEFSNIGFNEAKTHYLHVEFGARAKNTYHRGKDGKKSKPGLVLTNADFGSPYEGAEQADLVVAGGILNRRAKK